MQPDVNVIQRRPDRQGTILYHEQVVTLGNRQHALHVDRKPEVMHDADRLGSAGDRRLELIEIEVPGFRFGIDEHASSAAQLNRMSCGDMRLGRHDDFVLRSEIQEHIRQV